MGAPVHSEIIIMKAFIFATVLAVAAAVPIEDTEEVKAAKVTFNAAFAAATAGEHIALRPAAVESAYIDDAADVAEAKAAFQAVFDKYAAGEVALPVAPVHEVPAVVAPALAPVAIAAPVAAPYWHGAYPYAHAGYPYAHAAYAGVGWAGYPHGFYGKAAACVNAANIPVPCA